MYSCERPHMAEQKQDDQHKHTFSNYVRIRDVVQKTCLRRWTIGKSGERGSGILVLPARHDDDDDDDWRMICLKKNKLTKKKQCFFLCLFIYLFILLVCFLCVWFFKGTPPPPRLCGLTNSFFWRKPWILQVYFPFLKIDNFLTLPVLFSDHGVDSNDPRWLGAWWLGFIIIGLSGFLGLPLAFFPRFMRKPEAIFRANLNAKNNEMDTSGKSLLENIKGIFCFRVCLFFFSFLFWLVVWLTVFCWFFFGFFVLFFVLFFVF